MEISRKLRHCPANSTGYEQYRDELWMISPQLPEYSKSPFPVCRRRFKNHLRLHSSNYKEVVLILHRLSPLLSQHKTQTKQHTQQTLLQRAHTTDSQKTTSPSKLTINFQQTNNHQVSHLIFQNGLSSAQLLHPRDLFHSSLPPS